MNFNRIFALAGLTALAMLSACTSHEPARTALPEGATAELALLETTDLHTNILGYDYYRLTPDDGLGFDRVATLIGNARKEFANTLLVDNGDTIQGTALADYQAQVNPLPCDQQLAMYKAMDAVGYDVAGIGNHEFNYGLPFLAQVTGRVFNVAGMPEPSQQKRCAGPKFPHVLANVFSSKDRKTLFDPYVILDRKIRAIGPGGAPIELPIKVGFIGYTPPTILAWDKRWLEGKIYTEGWVETAEKLIPEMKAKGADVIAIISHAGLDAREYSPTMENGNWHLAKVAGVDALLIGHSHQPFPDANSRYASFSQPGVDKVNGTVNGVPTVMANFWGKSLGVIALNLTVKQGQWAIDKTKTKVQLRHVKQGEVTAPADSRVLKAIENEHLATISYIKTPIGQADFRMTSYLAEVGDVSALQVVNAAQRDYVSRYVADNFPALVALPVLSMAAPFKSGFAGATDYTDVASGPLAINNAADLYLFPNTLYAVKVTGLELKGWLENSARRFNQIDPAKTEPQALLTTFPSYNFDVLQGEPNDIRYEFDLTAAQGQRVKRLTYKKQPVADTALFIVATNNYRATGGGGVPALLGGRKTLFESPDTNREILIKYIKNKKMLNQTNFAQDRVWQFSPTTGQANITFRTAPAASGVITQLGLAQVQLASATPDDKGRVLYRLVPKP